MGDHDDIPCGPNADNRHCPVYWELSAENERLNGVNETLRAQLADARDPEVSRLHGLIRELLDTTGLDDEEQAEWLDRAGIHDDEDSTDG